jgi:hypothetical protein
MHKPLLLLFCAFLLAGCGIDYDGTRKLIFEGRVTDAAGAPLSGIAVRTSISNNYTSDITGAATTNKDGRYRMIFPKADEEVEVSVDMNYAGYDQPDDSPYTRTAIVNIHLDQVSDYKIDFGTTALYKKSISVPLHLDLAGVSSLNVIKTNAIGMVSDNLLDYNFADLYSNIDDDYPGYHIQTDFLVAKNQTITVKALLSDGSVIEAQIPIGEAPVNYNLEY